MGVSLNRTDGVVVRLVCLVRHEHIVHWYVYLEGRNVNGPDEALLPVLRLHVSGVYESSQLKQT